MAALGDLQGPDLGSAFPSFRCRPISSAGVPVEQLASYGDKFHLQAIIVVRSRKSRSCNCRSHGGILPESVRSDSPFAASNLAPATEPQSPR